MLIEAIFFGGFIALGTILFFIYKPQPGPLTVEAINRLKTESPIERRLFDALVYRGYSPETQIRCGKYRMDLTLPQYGLCLECDGKDYHSSPSQKARDRRRDAYLRSHGWKVLRFTGKQINGNMKAVIMKIEEEIEVSRQADAAYVKSTEVSTNDESRRNVDPKYELT